MCSHKGSALITYYLYQIQGKGRMFLLMYALFLVMNHPMKNFNANIMVMSESATCGQEMALNKTKDLVKAAVAPMQSK